MTFNPNFSTKISAIVQKIENNEMAVDTGAPALFDEYLNEITDIGPYTSESWPLAWRKIIYQFGELFQTRDSAIFLQKIEAKISSTPESDRSEVLDFIRSEIFINFTDRSAIFLRPLLKDLCVKYPHNAEFHHSLALFYFEPDCIETGIEENRIAIKLDQQNHIFIDGAFNLEYEAIQQALAKDDLQLAEKRLASMRGFEPYNRTHVFKNWMVGVGARIGDYKNISNRLHRLDDEISEKVNGTHARLIEIMGFFVAVLAFAFINVDITATKPLNEAKHLILMLAITLVLFAISISYLFTDRKKSPFWDFLHDRKFWAIIALAGALIALYIIKP